MMEWQEYTVDESERANYVPMEQWGHDHYSTLLYLETCIVDQGGKANRSKMRCNPRLHREFANMSAHGGIVDGSQYPTRLKEGTLDNHDDWSCLEDMVAAGLLRAEFRVNPHGHMFGNGEACVSLTENGARVAAELRQWKAAGKRLKDFEPGKEPAR